LHGLGDKNLAISGLNRKSTALRRGRRLRVPLSCFKRNALLDKTALGNIKFYKTANGIVLYGRV